MLLKWLWSWWQRFQLASSCCTFSCSFSEPNLVTELRHAVFNFTPIASSYTFSSLSDNITQVISFITQEVKLLAFSEDFDAVPMPHTWDTVSHPVRPMPHNWDTVSHPVRPMPHTWDTVSHPVRACIHNSCGTMFLNCFFHCGTYINKHSSIRV